MSAFEILDAPEIPVKSERCECARADLSARLAEILPRCFAEAAGAGLGPGRPFLRHHGARGEEIMFEAGVMLGRAPKEGGASIAASRVAAAVHLGPYEGLRAALAELDAAVRAAGYKPAPGAWEVYETDPADEPDPARWRTRLYLPLR